MKWAGEGPDVAGGALASGPIGRRSALFPLRKPHSD